MQKNQSAVTVFSRKNEFLLFFPCGYCVFNLSTYLCTNKMKRKCYRNTIITIAANQSKGIEGDTM